MFGLEFFDCGLPLKSELGFHSANFGLHATVKLLQDLLDQVCLARTRRPHRSYCGFFS